MTPVYDENHQIIGYTNGKVLIKINPNKKSIMKMSPGERVFYEQNLFNEFDNPFNDEQDLDILIDKLAIFNKYIDEDYNLREVPQSWLREEDLNLRPSGYEPDELPGCSIPRQWLGWEDSNLRMTESKSVALPLGDSPMN